MDDADRAQIEIERTLAANLERAASMARQVLGKHPTSTECSDCGGAIEGPRVIYGFATCASCAKDREYFQLHGRTYR